MKRLQDMDLSDLVHWASLKVLKGIFTGTLESEIHYVVDTMLDQGRERYIAKQAEPSKGHTIYHPVTDGSDLYFLTPTLCVVLSLEENTHERRLLGSIVADGRSWIGYDEGGRRVDGNPFQNPMQAEIAIRQRR